MIVVYALLVIVMMPFLVVAGLGFCRLVGIGLRGGCSFAGEIVNGLIDLTSANNRQ